LVLDSETQAGIKISSGQIAGGGFNIAEGQTKDLDINFETCCSVIWAPYAHLNPVLYAGELSTMSSSIKGTVLDISTGSPVPGTVTVSAEQKGSSGVDRIIMSTIAAADGTFNLCPLPVGAYDIVIVGSRASDGALYAPTIITGIHAGNSVGNVQIGVPSGANATTATNVVTLNGKVRARNSSNEGSIVAFQLSALTTIDRGTPVTYTIPLPPTSTQTSAMLGGATIWGEQCPAGNCLDASDYTLNLPASGVNIGAWSSTGTTLSLSATWATYTIDAIASVLGGGTTLDCNPSEIQKTLSILTPDDVAGPIAVPTMDFVQCQ
jgi:hypothetical protein